MPCFIGRDEGFVCLGRPHFIKCGGNFQLVFAAEIWYNMRHLQEKGATICLKSVICVGF